MFYACVCKIHSSYRLQAKFCLQSLGHYDLPTDCKYTFLCIHHKYILNSFHDIYSQDCFIKDKLLLLITWDQKEI